MVDFTLDETWIEKFIFGITRKFPNFINMLEIQIIYEPVLIKHFLIF